MYCTKFDIKIVIVIPMYILLCKIELYLYLKYTNIWTDKPNYTEIRNASHFQCKFWTKFSDDVCLSSYFYNYGTIFNSRGVGRNISNIICLSNRNQVTYVLYTYILIMTLGTNSRKVLKNLNKSCLDLWFLFRYNRFPHGTVIFQCDVHQSSMTYDHSHKSNYNLPNSHSHITYV